MAGNAFGHSLVLTTFGESHGDSIGGILDGIPPNMPVDLALIQHALDQRKPGSSSVVTPRAEADQIQILSGLYDNKTLGTPLAFRILNTNQQSKDYDTLTDVFRPGHGDYTYEQKYGHRDHRGGGRASARCTAARVAAGSVAHQILNFILRKKIIIQACLVQLGDHATSIPTTTQQWDFAKTNPFSCPCPETLARWESYLEELKQEGRSCGANIYIEALSIPAGLGEPEFDKIDADLAKAFMSINAVKAVAIGQTFQICQSPVSFDEMIHEGDTLKFLSNISGGSLAGITTGQPVTALVGFKATSSTPAVRKMVTKEGKNIKMGIHGRHDPCVALRAIPITKAMMALTLADHLLRFRAQCSLPL